MFGKFCVTCGVLTSIWDYPFHQQTSLISLFYTWPFPPLTHRTHSVKLTSGTASFSTADCLSMTKSLFWPQTLTLMARQSSYSRQWQMGLKCARVCASIARSGVRKAPLPLRKGEHSCFIFKQRIFNSKVKFPLNVSWMSKSWRIPPDSNYVKASTLKYHMSGECLH